MNKPWMKERIREIRSNLKYIEKKMVDYNDNDESYIPEEFQRVLKDVIKIVVDTI